MGVGMEGAAVVVGVGSPLHCAPVPLRRMRLSGRNGGGGFVGDGEEDATPFTPLTLDEDGPATPFVCEALPHTQWWARNAGFG